MPKKSNYSISADRWDFRVSDKAFDRVLALKQAYKRMASDHPTGAEVMRDLFHSLVKSKPELEPQENLDPRYWVNRKIMESAMELDEFQSLRGIGTNDPVGASIACTTLEPDLQVLFDKLKEAEKKAEELAKAMEELEAEEGDPSEEAQDIIDQLTADLEDELSDIPGMVQESLQQALDEANEQREAMVMAQEWGMEAGTLKAMSPEARLELAKRMNNPHLKSLADIIGRLEEMALTSKSQMAVQSLEEVYDIERGRDLSRMLPFELVSLDDDELFNDWARKYTEGALTQYALHGTEEVSKGGILLLEDGSGSMGGQRAHLAKAMGLALLKIAQKSNRNFTVIHFGSVNQFIQFNFDTKSDSLRLEIVDPSGKVIEKCSGVDSVIKYAELGFSYGGTDFQTPLTRAREILAEEFAADGVTTADIVMVSDGECSVTSKWLDEFKAEQAKLKFRVFGILVDSFCGRGSMNGFCDVLVTPKNLLTGEGLEEVMQAL